MIAVTNLNTSIGDYQRNYIWKLVIESYPVLIDSSYSQAKTVASEIDYYVSKFPVPESSTNIIKVPWAGEFFNLAGTTANSGEASVELFVDKDFKAYDFFKTWKSLNGTDQNHAAFPRQLCQGIFLFHYVDVDKETINKTVKLTQVNCFSVEKLEMDKGGSDVAKINLKFGWEHRFDVSGSGKKV